MDERFSARTNEVLSRAEVAIHRARGLTTAFSSLREEVSEEIQGRSDELAQEPDSLGATDNLTTYTWPVEPQRGRRTPEEHQDAEVAVPRTRRRSPDEDEDLWREARDAWLSSELSGYRSFDRDASSDFPSAPRRPLPVAGRRAADTELVAPAARLHGGQEPPAQPRSVSAALEDLNARLELVRRGNRALEERRDREERRRAWEAREDAAAATEAVVASATVEAEAEAAGGASAPAAEEGEEGAAGGGGGGGAGGGGGGGSDSEGMGDDESGAGSDENPYTCLREPVMLVAQRLATLQQQQAETMRQLLRLRLEQLRLRQQQLSALQCLLRTEAACIEGLQGNPLQLSAVQAAVDLLADSLEDVHMVASGLQWDGEVAQVAAVAQNVSEADSRAEEVSAMARQLLAALRRHPMHPRREGAASLESAAPPEDEELRGATPEEIAKHPVRHCTSECAALGEQCPICLATFGVEDEIREIQCAPPSVTHTFHRGCIDEWLGIKASCPLCKHEIV